MKRIALLVCPWIVACAPAATERTGALPVAESHARMIRVLADLPLAKNSDYAVVASRRAELELLLAETTESADPVARATALSEAATLDLRAGELRRALERIDEAIAIEERHRRLSPPGMRSTLLFRKGVACLRLGETENCCRRWTPDSCIFPIQGEGIHEKREGSEAAMACFRSVAETTAPHSALHRTSVWLMNIAAMTLGEYPRGVPEAYRIPASAFRSEETIPRFRNVARELGLDTFGLSGGVAADDFDGDGDVDLVVSDWDPRGQIRAFRNDGDGSFQDDTARAGLMGITGGLNLVHADYDNDGDLDVFVLRGAWLGARHPNSLLQNQGDGRFVDVTFAVGLGEVHYPTQTAGWADYDNDGDLDLYVGNEWNAMLEAPGQLFRNDGAKGFTDVAGQAGVQNRRFTKAVAWGDYDNDRYPDLYVSNHDSANRLYRNRGDGTFEDVTERCGVGAPTISFPAWFWDYDNDGNLDLFAFSYDYKPHDIVDAYRGIPSLAEPTRLYRGDGRGGFTDVAESTGVARPAMPMGSNFGDLDGDGWLDFYLGTGAPPFHCLTPNLMMLNRDGKRFLDVTTAGGLGQLQKGHAIAFADFDNDGDPDVFEQMGGAFPADAYADALYENPGFGNRWISLQLVGRRSNRCGIGARIAVRVATAAGAARTIFRHVSTGGSFGSSPLTQLIGLGKAARIESIEVFWPTTGTTQRFAEVALDKAYLVDEDRDALTPRAHRPFPLGPRAPD